MTSEANLVHVLEADPELAGDLAPEELAAANRAAVTRRTRIPKGLWNPAEHKPEPGHFGMLILDGLLARQVTIGTRTGAEILGPGDVLRPWVSVHRRASIRSDVNWVAVVASDLALMDAAFLQRVTRWPQITAALGSRVMLRAHWTAFHLAICHMRRVDERLLIVLWHFADRWGTIEASGVRIPLPFTHRLLASVVGAQRPSVTSALHELVERGLVTQAKGRDWILHGEPPERLHQLRDQIEGHDRPSLGVDDR